MMSSTETSCGGPTIVFDKFRSWMDRQNGAFICPSCHHSNKEGSNVCVRCYYQINKSAFNQDPTMGDSESTDLLDLLASEIEEIDSEEEVMPAAFSMDDVTVEVAQYAGDDEVSLSQTPNFKDLSPKPSQETEEIYELSEADIPLFVNKFEIPQPEEDQTSIKEPTKKPIELVHPTAETPKSVELVSASYIPDPIDRANTPESNPTLDPADFDGDGNVDEFEAAFAEEGTDSSKPQFPKQHSSDLEIGEGEKPVPRAPFLTATQIIDQTPNDIQRRHNNEDVIFSNDIEIEQPPKNSIHTTSEAEKVQFWPWIQQDEWSPSEVKHQLLASMRAAKEQNFAEATVLLDDLGPHLGKKTQLLYSIGRLLIAIGRTQDANKMIENAIKEQPNDPNVSLARQKLVS